MKRLLSVLVLFACVSFAFAGPQDLADASGTITSGGTSQALLTSSQVSGAIFVFIQNREATDHLYINFGSAAASTGQSSIDIAPGGLVWFDVFVPSNAINIIGPTTGDKFVCKYR